ncbi:MAG TPA: hypothetical protein DC017_09705 [Candidatus Wallbacteria bacterium]|nr:hypothetical protein [Candidatus Wallbacteria bacterium]
MAVLTQINLVSFSDFFTTYAANDGGKIISSVSNSGCTGTNCCIVFSFSNGDSRVYNFSSSVNTSKISFDTFITLLVSNIGNLRFISISPATYGLLYYFFVLAVSSSYWTVLSAYPYSPFLWTHINLLTGSNYRATQEFVSQKVFPWNADCFVDYTYDDGSGLFRHSITDISNNAVTPQLQYIQGPAGAQGPVGPAGPAGDPGPVGSTPDMSAVVEKLTLISDKLTAIDSNLVAVVGSASSPVDIVGINV